MRFTNQGAIAEAGGVKALVDLIFKWSFGGDGVLVCSSFMGCCFFFSFLIMLTYYTLLELDMPVGRCIAIENLTVSSHICGFRNVRLVPWRIWLLMISVARRLLWQVVCMLW